jgi:hypothetical protein
MKEGKRYQFRVNGLVMPFIRIQYERIAGAQVGRRQIAVEDDQIGWVVIDDNEGLPDPALPKFFLEVRDFPVPGVERRFLPNQGWRQISTLEMLGLLEDAGIITRE